MRSAISTRPTRLMTAHLPAAAGRCGRACGAPLSANNQCRKSSSEPPHSRLRRWSAGSQARACACCARSARGCGSCGRPPAVQTRLGNGAPCKTAHYCDWRACSPHRGGQPRPGARARRRHRRAESTPHAAGSAHADVARNQPAVGETFGSAAPHTRAPRRQEPVCAPEAVCCQRGCRVGTLCSPPRNGRPTPSHRQCAAAADEVDDSSFSTCLAAPAYAPIPAAGESSTPRRRRFILSRSPCGPAASLLEHHVDPDHARRRLRFDQPPVAVALPLAHARHLARRRRPWLLRLLRLRGRRRRGRWCH